MSSEDIPAEAAPMIEETPTAALEAEAPATDQAASETLMETPPEETAAKSEAEAEGEAEPEGETVTVIVTTGTGVAKRVGSLGRGESGGDEAPVIEFSWFGDDAEDDGEADETPPLESVAVPELAIQPGEEDTVSGNSTEQEADQTLSALDAEAEAELEAEPEADPEPTTETVTLESEAAGQAMATGSGEPLGTEAPSTEFNWFWLTPAVDPEELAEEDAPLPTDPVATQPATTARAVDGSIPTVEIDLFEAFVPSTDNSAPER